MWALPGDKKILLDLFGKEQVHQRPVCEVTPDTLARYSSDELLFLWASEPRERRLPDVVVVRPDEMREFIAWATTVIDGYRPFTAFFKVVDRKQAELAIEDREPRLDRLENPLVGLILGETLTLSANQESISALSLLPCESTYSFSFARAFALGCHQRSSNGDPIAAPWALARRLTRQTPRRLGDESLQTALSVITALAADTKRADHLNIPEFIRETCCELYSQGEVKRSWSVLGNRLPSLDLLMKDMRGPRELRVLTFERVLGEPNDLDTPTSSFLAGLLANQVAPGTFDHVDLLVPYLPKYPMALVWYGLCAGLYSDSEVQQVGNCIGRRIVRDLLVPDPLVSRPKYDISIAELEVCLDREVAIEFRVASQNHIAVEIVPGVPAFMKWPAKEPNQPTDMSAPAARGASPLPSVTQRNLFSGGSESNVWREGQAAIADLERATGRVRAIWTELARKSSDDPPPEGGGRRRGNKPR
jgi:hypothetical protein